MEQILRETGGDDHPPQVNRTANELPEWFIEGVKPPTNAGVPQNGTGTLRNMAEQGDADAQHRLGVYYYDKGFLTNYKEAVNWYRKAAEQEHADAQDKLGKCYANGNGVQRDQEEARKWFRRAIETKRKR